MLFSELSLSEPLLRSIAAEGYQTPTPIQAQAIPHVLEGRDLLGCAQTGTGKTAAFALPILQRLGSSATAGRRNVRCLVLCPTRELALQIADSFRVYGKQLTLKHTVVFGGVNQNPQAAALRQGVDILIATPGRLLDLMNQRLCDLRHVEVLVLDEADRMLDMGFIQDIRRIVATLQAKRQTLLFSATMPNEIRRLADSLLRNPVSVQITPPATTLQTIDQSVYFVDRQNKPALLAHLYTSLPMARTIVFTRTKHGADRVVRQLHTRGIRAESIHGNKSQNARERALANFRANRTPILVATDIASRGIDIDGISHVVNYDLTHEPETYIHRIGRTARAGASGAAVSFCDRDERPNLKAIESLIRRSIPVRNDHPSYAALNSAPLAAPASPHRQDRRPPAPQRQSQPGRPTYSAHSSQGESPRPNRPAGRHPFHSGAPHRGPVGQRRHSGRR
jgi:ATP-dependent RNA helicase RhlE